MQKFIAYPFLKDEKILLQKINQNQEIELNLMSELPWISSILEELNENIDQEELQNFENPPTLNINLTLSKFLDLEGHENLIIKGQLTGHYYNPCVRCLETLNLPLEINFSAVFLPDSLMNLPEYEDQLTLFIKDQELDLYFYPRKEVNLKEFLHEQIFLNIDPIPLHNEDCRGLCQVCGTNLNYEQCTHP